MATQRICVVVYFLVLPSLPYASEVRHLTYKFLFLVAVLSESLVGHIDA